MKVEAEIVIKIGKTEHKLKMDEVKELHKILDDLVGYKTYTYPIYVPQNPYYTYWTCSNSDNGSSTITLNSHAFGGTYENTV